MQPTQKAARLISAVMQGEIMLIRHEDLKPLEFDELKIIDYTAGHDTNSSFAEITVPPGISHKLSWSNRSDKYYYIIQGDVSFTINDESYNLLPGDVCIIPKGARFKYSNTGTKDVKLILVHTPSFKLECEVFE
jgi:mannose-6-phosphate isomerase-like protein (cupin superfamily)